MPNRVHRCEIRFTESEYQQLECKAQKAGLCVSAFVRRAIETCEIKEVPPADLPKLIREIRRVGSNIDQVLMIANARGLLDVPQLRKAISELRDVEKLIVNTYTGR